MVKKTKAKSREAEKEEIVDKEDEESEDEEDIYEKEDDEKMLEDDEITPNEAGFMEGYEGEGKSICTCDNCGQHIDPTDAVEKFVAGKNRTFCSYECSEEYEERVMKKAEEEELEEEEETEEKEGNGKKGKNEEENEEEEEDY